MTFEVHTDYEALRRATSAGIDAMHARIAAELADQAEELLALPEDDAIEPILDIWRRNGLRTEGYDARPFARSVLATLREQSPSSASLES